MTYTHGQPHPGSRELIQLTAGDVRYSVGVLPFRMDKANQKVAESRLPQNSAYHTAAEQGAPEHYLSCNVPISPPFSNDVFCRFAVVYQPGEDLFIDLIYLKSESFGFAGFGAEDFNLSNLPNHVCGLHRAFQAIEIVKDK
ncbi:hypothetical protein [Tropicibacter sp. Alg240-R139]|uniref:hypothetical protein n=1 Tax=Tropicibacter sp. Alg240-R139 TaxID=2305991 RepID=UPI0013DE9A33|nr:hypothetical protein [Tropicibacter sp. Alg240-R139]